MLVGLFAIAYVVWTIGVVVYFCSRNFWTFVRYLTGAIVVAQFGTPSMVAGFAANTTNSEMVVTLIWMHLGGSLLSPAIFGLTVLPVLIFMAVKK